ncbi:MULTISPECIES: sulfite exporter TauE/SafE family protein [Gracilibacillus]|uniref:sulfite exporter TauE/SafE family protein n=1 Tax=Gracilibacillus TaxID=74385 RepID=UPI00082406D4|nr:MULTISPECIES: sulfite exporter TauE/SafE family protein [Gracilibacillus]
MLVIGLLLGFIGAGGSGVIIAVLSAVFGFPIHTALGTSLAAMVFSSLSGTLSHLREGNTVIKIGVATGVFGACGAFFGSQLANIIPGEELKWFTAGMLILSAILLWLRVTIGFGRFATQTFASHNRSKPARFWLAAGSIGIVTGLLSGVFGIGSTPFIQIGLLVFFGLSIQQSAGTTMLVIIPIALIGGLGYYSVGFLDLQLFIEVVAGTMAGSYLGAKFTTRLHPLVLKIAMVAVPLLGGIVLLF